MKPLQFCVLDKKLDDNININQKIIGPIPYIGGEVEFLTALFAASTNNYLDEVTKIVCDLNQITILSELSNSDSPVSSGSNDYFNKLSIFLKDIEKRLAQELPEERKLFNLIFSFIILFLPIAKLLGKLLAKAISVIRLTN